MIDGASLTYKPYPRVGLSGQLYIASGDNCPDLLVKRNYISDVANEFYGHHLAAMLGNFTPRTYFISGTVPAVGIEYIYDAGPIKEYNLVDFAVCIAVTLLGNCSDSMQMMQYNDRNFLIDYGECFGLNDYTFRQIKRYGKKSLPDFFTDIEDYMKVANPLFTNEEIKTAALEVKKRIALLNLQEWEEENREIISFLGLEIFEYYKALTVKFITLYQKHG